MHLLLPTILFPFFLTSLAAGQPAFHQRRAAIANALADANPDAWAYADSEPYWYYDDIHARDLEDNLFEELHTRTALGQRLRPRLRPNENTPKVEGNVKQNTLHCTKRGLCTGKIVVAN